MDQPTVFGLSYSPWTYKARWALALAGIEYRYREYLPMLGKLPMRVRLNRWTSPITVPLMRVGKELYPTSWDIARFADRDDALQTSQQIVARWNEISDRLLELGRIRISLAIQTQPDALRAALPSMFQRMPGGLAIARMGANYMLKTYPVSTQSSEIEEAMTQLLGEVRQALNGGLHLSGSASYADIAIASSLQMINPTSTDFVPLDPRLHDVWGCSTLADRFRDLCSWRDEIFKSFSAPRLGVSND